MNTNDIGLIMTISAVVMIGILLFRKIKFSHPVMFCNYSLLTSGLGLSVLDNIKDIAFIASIILALICVFLLPTKTALINSNKAISDLKKSGEPVSLFGLVVSKLNRQK